MLQLNSIFYNPTTRNSCWSLWRLTTMFNSSNTAVNPGTQPVTKSTKANVKEDIDPMKEQNSLTQKINNTKDVHELIKLSKNPNLNPQHVIEIMSAINRQLTNKNKQNRLDYNSEELKSSVSTIIQQSTKANSSEMTNSLVKEFSNFSIPLLVQVLKKLSVSRQRNVPLLKLLCHNIQKASSSFDIYTAVTILYSLATLNYIHEELLNKVLQNVQQTLVKNPTLKGYTVGSIMTSIGLLRYKNSQFLDILCEWSTLNLKELRHQDISAVLQSFATFGYQSKSLDEFIQNSECIIQKGDISNIQEWLDIVWSLAVLDKANPSHLASVLGTTFVDQILGTNELNISKRLKLLNINGVAQFLMKDYNGPFLEEGSRIFDIPLERAKRRNEMINALSEALKEIVPVSCFNTNVNTDMGFCIDVECLIDSQKTPNTLTSIAEDIRDMRIAIMIHDYQDYCKGERDILGIVNLHHKLLKAKEYKILTISYLNFSPEDSNEKRVSYLKRQLQNIKTIST